jgi:hypothetical protein
VERHFIKAVKELKKLEKDQLRNTRKTRKGKKEKKKDNSLSTDFADIKISNLRNPPKTDLSSVMSIVASAKMEVPPWRDGGG